MAADGEIGTSAMAKPFPVLGILIARKGPDDNSAGVTVFEVCRYSPAERCGVQKGDVILKLDDTPVSTRENLIQFLKSRSIGSDVEVTLKCGDLTLVIPVTLDRFVDV